MATNDTLPLLLLPGLLNDRRLYAHQIDGLSDIATIHVGDLTGADRMADLARHALASAPAGRFALAGLSMGGYVALEIMRQAPERVRGLALLDTTARPDTAESTANRHRFIALSATDFRAVVGALLPRLLHPAHLQDSAITGAIHAMADSVGREAFVRQQTAIMHRIDSRPHLARIQCPTLVLCGREDAITPVDVHAEMAAAVPGARLVVIERCGHLATLEQPAEVTAALRTWLATLP
jgi:pimeloyl-ACP methyl ester carboxylesterase